MTLKSPLKQFDLTRSGEPREVREVRDERRGDKRGEKRRQARADGALRGEAWSGRWRAEAGGGAGKRQKRAGGASEPVRAWQPWEKRRES